MALGQQKPQSAPISFQASSGPGKTQHSDILAPHNCPTSLLSPSTGTEFQPVVPEAIWGCPQLLLDSLEEGLQNWVTAGSLHSY